MKNNNKKNTKEIGNPCNRFSPFALAEKNHWQIRFVRMALDILVVVTGVLFGGKFGVCTLITVIISGPIIQFVNAKAKQVLKI